jgi:hypothetical protein
VIITEEGVLHPPFDRSLAEALDRSHARKGRPAGVPEPEQVAS